MPGPKMTTAFGWAIAIWSGKADHMVQAKTGLHDFENDTQNFVYGKYGQFRTIQGRTIKP